MNNTRLRILVTTVGLSVLGLALSCTRAASNDSGTRGAGAPASSSPFTYCTGTYALCTTAQCKQLDNLPQGFLSCPCDVKVGPSVGMEPCADVPTFTPDAGLAIPSRYYPPDAMVVCPGPTSPPWASCLDMPCVVDSNNPKRATCVCMASTNLWDAGVGPYIVDMDNGLANPCSTPNVSSATFVGAGQMSCFLEPYHYKPPTLLDGGTWPDCGQP